MNSTEICSSIRQTISRLTRDAFGQDFEALLKSRGNELWILGLDSDRSEYIDICGLIPPTLFSAISARGYFDADAGYRADAQNVLPLKGHKVDIFLLNKNLFNVPADQIEPLVVHEIAHMFEHTGVLPTLQGKDLQNAEVILASLQDNILRLHTQEWALHLAVGARRLVDSAKTDHRTIGAFLNAAIPSYDRKQPIIEK